MNDIDVEETDTDNEATSAFDDYTLDQCKHNNELASTRTPDAGKGKTVSSVHTIENNKLNTSYGTSSGNLILNQVITFTENVFCIRATPDNTLWAVGLQNGNINFYSTDNAENSFMINNLKAASENYPVTHMEFITFDKQGVSDVKHFLLASYASGFIRLWHYTSSNVRSRLIREWKENFFHKLTDDSNEQKLNQILCISVSGDSQRFVTGGDDAVIKVYEITSKTVLRILYKEQTHSLQTGRASDAVLSADFHTLRITAIKYHPSGKTDSKYTHVFISASWDNTIQIWDDRKLGSLWQYIGPHVCGSDGIDIDPYTNNIISCSWKREKAVLQIWKFNEFVLNSAPLDGRSLYGQYSVPVAEYYQDTSNIPSQGYVTQFILNGQYIMYGGSNNNVFRIVESNSFTPYGAMFNIKSAVISASLSINTEKRKVKVAVASAKHLLIFNVEIKISNLRKASGLS